MTEGQSNRRIKYAFQLPRWSLVNGNRDCLMREALRVAPSEYQIEMDGSIFFPSAIRFSTGCPNRKSTSPMEEKHIFSS